ncbi:hypothetical protein D3C87_1697670 [compost metagenome]
MAVACRPVDPVLPQRHDGRAGRRTLQPAERKRVDAATFDRTRRKRFRRLTGIGRRDAFQQDLWREDFAEQAVDQKCQQDFSFA